MLLQTWSECSFSQWKTHCNNCATKYDKNDFTWSTWFVASRMLSVRSLSESTFLSTCKVLCMVRKLLNICMEVGRIFCNCTWWVLCMILMLLAMTSRTESNGSLKSWSIPKLRVVEVADLHGRRGVHWLSRLTFWQVYELISVFSSSWCQMQPTIHQAITGGSSRLPELRHGYQQIWSDDLVGVLFVSSGGHAGWVWSLPPRG